MDEIFEIAASGELESIYNQGKMYELSEGVEQSLEKSLKCYKANAELHLKTRGILKSAEYYEKNADKRFKRAAENYNFEVLAVGIMYLNGYGVEKNFDKAREYFEKAANFKAHPANYFLGEMYENGLGVEKNLETARNFYKLSSALLNEGVVNSFIILIKSFSEKDDLEKFYSELYAWRLDAANLGNSDCMWKIGIMYEKGHHVEKNMSRALEWYEKSAALGNSEAMRILGYLYEHGEGVPQNYQKAVEWYEKAVELKNTYALNNLSKMYREGKGVEKNPGKADELFDKFEEIINDVEFVEDDD